ncbi:transcriptional regulator [Streptomyces longisporoflavus]|uniref:helix-turn-helix domain-containing protein n=1 Tax=Streptomyces longisporoflavus TaxID=28044 RepID=UPI00167F0448|nr:helix-turn-helix transcriptional regulator [Streptomyces longisporoflavus]GGV52431.1 transcriptional regulator [Streptomyces longisporoflavus]
MASRKDIDGSASVPAFYGKELRWKREAAGRTLAETVEGSYFGASYLSEIERGQRRMPVDLARHVDQLLKTDGFFERRCGDVQKARRSKHAEYFAHIVELEKRAKEIEEWNPTLIPGPLQLEPYIRAVIRAAHPWEAEESVKAKVEARRERAWLFEDPKGPECWAVLHESILRQPLVGEDAMAEQLAHIVAVAQHRRFIPQILPWNAGPHPFMMGTTWLMTFTDAPPLMYTEGMYSGQIIDEPELVGQYAGAYGRLRAAALPPKQSLKMIETAAEAYGNGKYERWLQQHHLA